VNVLSEDLLEKTASTATGKKVDHEGIKRLLLQIQDSWTQGEMKTVTSAQFAKVQQNSARFERQKQPLF
jgi:hypothetical protein